jgi:PIN domain nuclease of toxin-antitoxin system
LLRKDPFDRLLIAQARAEDLTLVTADPIFSQYLVACMGLMSTALEENEA